LRYELAEVGGENVRRDIPDGLVLRIIITYSVSQRACWVLGICVNVRVAFERIKSAREKEEKETERKRERCCAIVLC
jgi:hypothetical protein